MRTELIEKIKEMMMKTRLDPDSILAELRLLDIIDETEKEYIQRDVLYRH